MNLLVGLAISDVQVLVVEHVYICRYCNFLFLFFKGLRAGAKVARLSRLVIAISQLESMLFSKGFINILPKKIVMRLRKSALLSDKMYVHMYFKF
jgi:hypothetical protein